MKINRLENNQVKTKLKQNLELDNKIINEIIQEFWRLDAYNSLVSIPRFLDILVTYLKETKLEGLFEKYDFYRYLFSKVSGGGKFLDKLTRLALVMELHQVNEFNSIEFMEILNRLEIDVKSLEQTGLTEKYEKEGEDVAGFCHHTISEFLVADFLSRQDNFIDRLEQFTLVKDDSDVLAIAFSWYGVIRFLLKSDKSNEVREWLLKLIENNNELVDDGFCDAITSVDSGSLSPKKRQQIFNLIYNTYQRKKIWLPIWTRARLFDFCQKDDYEKLKTDIQNDNGTKSDILVRRGIIVDIVARLMKNNSSLTAGSEKDWWKERLVNFANNNDENGVVQRHSLVALATYHDTKLISQVSGCLNHQDSLVREAFIQFCYETDPNNETVIEMLIKGIIKEKTDIYSRHGFYQITSKEGIKIFLKHLVNNPDFLKKFLDKESIFNSKDKNGDEVIIKKIEKFIDAEIIEWLKQIIKNLFERNDIHDQKRSYFLKKLATIIERKCSGYIFELVEGIKKSDEDKERKERLVYNYIALFSWLITTENVTGFHKQLSGISERCGRFADQVIYGTRYENESVYKLAVEKRLVTKIENLSDYQQDYDRDGEVVKEFRRQLGTDREKKYFPSVFEFFNQNEKLIISKWTKQEKERLRKLVIDEGLEKIEPRNIVVKIQKNEGGRINQYNISTIASYFGHVIRTAKHLGIELEEYRQKIVDFLPFAYSEDRQMIRETIDQIKDKDLIWVNKVYMDKTGDIRYFLPDSYIYLVRNYWEKGYKLNSARRVLLSFITDKELSSQDRKYAVETLGRSIGSENLEVRDEIKKDLGSVEANKAATDVLIAVFKNEEAIKGRIKQIKKWAKEAGKYKLPEIDVEHWVSHVELETDGMSLAQPLMKIGNDKYKNDFIDLLNYSAKILKDKKRKDVLWTYVNYLWKTVVGYFNGLENKDFGIIRELENWLDENRSIDKVNWFEGRLNTLRQVYIEEGSRKNIEDALRIAGGQYD